MKEVFDFYSLASGDSAKKSVTVSQIEEMVVKIGLDVTPEEVRKLAGASFSDQVDYPTFVKIFSNDLYQDVPKEEAIKAFELFDKKKTGKLSIIDFKHVLKNLSKDMNKQEIDDFLEMADTKKDGFIHYKEFVNTILK